MLCSLLLGAPTKACFVFAQDCIYSLGHYSTMEERGPQIQIRPSRGPSLNVKTVHRISV
jgi:hypothetical protein